MEQALPPEEPSQPAEQPSGGGWPQRQAYFVTVEWLDEPHQPESPERLGQVIRHAILHGHTVPHGHPGTRFIVRVKAGDVASEVEGELAHHHG